MADRVANDQANISQETCLNTFGSELDCDAVFRVLHCTVFVE